MLEQQKYISADEFYEIAQLPEYEDKIIELVQGEIIEMGKPGGEHGEITFEITRVIGNFVKEHRLGRCTGAETGYILFKNPDGKDTVRGHDFAFVSIERSPDPLPQKNIPFAPDLAVEVVSESNSASEIHRKVRDFLRAGTRMMLVVYPDTRTMVVHTPQGAYTLEIDDTFDGGDVLPGFKMAVRDIFP